MAAKTAKSSKGKSAAKLSNRHTGHANHLCELVSQRRMAKVATLSKGAKYVCNVCGRASAKAVNLCEPVEI